jgi:hypothetical protein
MGCRAFYQIDKEAANILDFSKGLKDTTLRNDAFKKKFYKIMRLITGI